MITLGALSLAFTFIRTFCFSLPQTPRYLLSQGRDQDAVDAVNCVAKKNCKPEPLTLVMLRDIDAQLGMTPSEDRQSIMKLSTRETISESMQAFRGQHYRALFATKKLARHTIIIWAIWLTIGELYCWCFRILCADHCTLPALRIPFTSISCRRIWPRNSPKTPPSAHRIATIVLNQRLGW